MKFAQIKDLESTELRKKLTLLNQEIFDSKMKLSMKRLPDPLVIRRLRKDKARLMTALARLTLKPKRVEHGRK